MSLAPRPDFKAYKKPRRINLVSIALSLFAVVVAYVGYCLWPVWSLNLAAKDQLASSLPMLYRANLRPGTKAEIDKIKKELIVNLRNLGVTDKKLEVIATNNKKLVSLEARFRVLVEFEYFNHKKHEFLLTPKVETDAERIEW
jgi:hypothetical protein